ncbi:hypothetical protein H0H92_010214 [Tricholoma furcatifolium]|nr:hypothetical protein H0H92_010214 [Tricholoma furcatifolium]
MTSQPAAPLRRSTRSKTSSKDATTSRKSHRSKDKKADLHETSPEKLLGPAAPHSPGARVGPETARVERNSFPPPEINATDEFPPVAEDVDPRQDAAQNLVMQERLPTPPYSFGTPASSRASPIRDPELISQPLRPDLEEIYPDIVNTMNILDEINKKDISRIVKLSAAAIRLQSRAETLRAALRSERAKRERYEAYIAHWRPNKEYGWSIQDVYGGSYRVLANATSVLADSENRLIEVDSDVEEDAIRISHELDADVSDDSRDRANRKHKRRREPEEDEGNTRYQARSRTHEPDRQPEATAKESLAQAPLNKTAVDSVTRSSKAGNTTRSTPIIPTDPRKRSHKRAGDDVDVDQDRHRKRPRTQSNDGAHQPPVPTLGSVKGKGKATDADYDRWEREAQGERQAQAERLRQHYALQVPALEQQLRQRQIDNARRKSAGQAEAKPPSTHRHPQ